MAKKKYYSKSMIMQPSNNKANMPQGSFIKEWPTITPNMPESIDDSMAYIDHQIKMDMKFKKSGPFPSKY